MTSNQIAYAQLLESQRSNKAKERETERSNRAKEEETVRSNRANEQETRRSNLSQEYNTQEKTAAGIKNIWGAAGYALRNLGRSTEDTSREAEYAKTGQIGTRNPSSTYRGTNHQQPVRGFTIYA